MAPSDIPCRRPRYRTTAPARSYTTPSERLCHRRRAPRSITPALLCIVWCRRRTTRRWSKPPRGDCPPCCTAATTVSSSSFGPERFHDHDQALESRAGSMRWRTPADALMGRHRKLFENPARRSAGRATSTTRTSKHLRRHNEGLARRAPLRLELRSARQADAGTEFLDLLTRIRGRPDRLGRVSALATTPCDSHGSSPRVLSLAGRLQNGPPAAQGSPTPSSRRARPLPSMA